MIPGHNISDFDSPDQPGSGKNMQSSTLSMIKKAEKIVGFHFTFTSAFRTKTHNKKVGGVPGSAHTRGYAVDIYVKNETQKIQVINALINAGFKRIGIGKHFIHADNDPAKPTPAVWLYKSTKNANGYALRKKVLAGINGQSKNGISLVTLFLISATLGLLLKNG